MTNEIPQMSLRQATLNKGSFTPIIYTPQMADMSILQNSLDKIEKRHKDAAEYNAKFNETATKLESLVDPSEQEWVRDYIGRLQESYKSSIDAGDYESAIIRAINAGSKLLKNPEAMGRIKNAEKINKFKETLQKKVDAGIVPEDHAKAWEIDQQDKFKSTDIIDDKTGAIIGVNEWKPSWQPLNKVDSPTKIQTIFKGISPEQGKKTWTTGKYNDKETTQTGGQKSYQRITKERFIPVLKEQFMEDSEWRNYIIQEQKSAKILLDNIDKQIDKETDPVKLNALKASREVYKQKASDEDGKIITDPFEFLQHKYKDTIDSLPYEYITTDNIDVTSPRTSSRKKTTTSGGEDDDVVKQITGDLDTPDGEQAKG